MAHIECHDRNLQNIRMSLCKKYRIYSTAIQKINTSPGFKIVPGASQPLLTPKNRSHSTSVVDPSAAWIVFYLGPPKRHSVTAIHDTHAPQPATAAKQPRSAFQHRRLLSGQSSACRSGRMFTDLLLTPSLTDHGATKQQPNSNQPFKMEI